jgi:hypothetical protein
MSAYSVLIDSILLIIKGIFSGMKAALFIERRFSYQSAIDGHT